MPIILHLETATKTCSVALSKNGELLALKEETSEKFSHAEKLNQFILDVLEVTGLTVKNLDAVAVSAGPGSYTGLRIGTSTAKGICYALQIPLISVDSLMALANLAKDADHLLCPMFDARRMEVYTAIYDQQLNAIVPTTAKVIDELSFREELDRGKVLFFGPGSQKCKSFIQSPNAIFKDITVSAKGMISISAEKFKRKQFEDLAYFEPAYLKDFIAGKPKKLL